MVQGNEFRTTFYSAADDSVAGDQNVLYGYAPENVYKFDGSKADNTIYGGDGVDRVSIKDASGNNTFYLGAGNDVVKDHNYSRLDGVSGHIYIDAGDGDDYIMLQGYDEKTTIQGGAGNDEIHFFNASVRADLYGGDGNDIISAPASGEGVSGQNFYGGRGADLMYGGEAEDVFYADYEDFIGWFDKQDTLEAHSKYTVSLVGNDGYDEVHLALADTVHDKKEINYFALGAIDINFNGNEYVNIFGDTLRDAAVVGSGVVGIEKFILDLSSDAASTEGLIVDDAAVRLYLAKLDAAYDDDEADELEPIERNYILEIKGDNDELVLNSYLGSYWQRNVIDGTKVTYTADVDGKTMQIILDESEVNVIFQESTSLSPSSPNPPLAEAPTIEYSVHEGDAGNNTITVGDVSIPDWKPYLTGNYHLIGHAGDDRLAAIKVNGQHVLDGGDGNDTLGATVKHGGGIIDGGAGRDTIWLQGHGEWTLLGGDGNDVFLFNDGGSASKPEGQYGAVYVDGGAGADILSGGRGNDIIIGDYHDIQYGQPAFYGAFHGFRGFDRLALKLAGSTDYKDHTTVNQFVFSVDNVYIDGSEYRSLLSGLNGSRTHEQRYLNHDREFEFSEKETSTAIKGIEEVTIDFSGDAEQQVLVMDEQSVNDFLTMATLYEGDYDAPVYKMYVKGSPVNGEVVDQLMLVNKSLWSHTVFKGLSFYRMTGVNGKVMEILVNENNVAVIDRAEDTVVREILGSALSENLYVGTQDFIDWSNKRKPIIQEARGQGGDDDVIIRAGSGDDYIFAHNSMGNNVIYADHGKDKIYLNYSSGNNTVYAGLLHDLINADFSSGDNELHGEGWNDTISLRYSAGDNYVTGGEGRDRVNMHHAAGNNRIEMGDDNDGVFGDYVTGNNTIDLGAGNDRVRIRFSESDNTLLGGDGNDRLEANHRNTGNNTLDGGKGADTLRAGGGNDLLIADYEDLDNIFNSTNNTTIDGGKGIDTLQLQLGDAVNAAGDAINHFYLGSSVAPEGSDNYQQLLGYQLRSDGRVNKGRGVKNIEHVEIDLSDGNADSLLIDENSLNDYLSLLSDVSDADSRILKLVGDDASSESGPIDELILRDDGSADFWKKMSSDEPGYVKYVHTTAAGETMEILLDESQINVII